MLTSAFFSGVVYVLIRRIGLSEHPLVIGTPRMDALKVGINTFCTPI